MIGWILLTREDVASAEKALESSEESVRDEVGFLVLHQHFADRFFPGTSVLHTRLRYALFVPWLIKKVAARRGSSVSILRELAIAETTLAGQLRKGQDKKGIIGGRVWPRQTAQLPSMSYWNALRKWGILKPRDDNSSPSRTEVLRKLASTHMQSSTTGKDDDGVAVSFEATSPFVSLPSPPKSIGIRDKPMDFVLSPEEQGFLRKHLLSVRRSDSKKPALLANLIETGVGKDAADPWVDSIAKVADAQDKSALTMARQAGSLACIGRAVYAALVEKLREKDGKPDCDRHRNRLRDMIDSYGNDARQVDFKSLRKLLPSLPESLTDLMSETQDWLEAGNKDPRPLLDIYAKTEKYRKGLRARLPDTLAGLQRRTEWDPLVHPLATPLQYRWSVVRQMLNDLQPS